MLPRGIVKADSDPLKRLEFLKAEKTAKMRIIFWIRESFLLYSEL